MSAPMMPPPPGGDVDRGKGLLGAEWTLVSIFTIFIIARIYTRRVLTRNLGWDDAVLVFATVLNLIHISFVTIAIHYGLGRHQAYLAFPNIIKVVKYQVIAEPFAITAVTLPKISVTMLLINIVRPSIKGLIWLWVLNAISVAIALSSITLLFAQCTPSSAFWTHQGKCWDPKIVTYIATAQGACSAFIDFSLALFPVPTVWALQLQTKKKISICSLMGFGCFAGVAAIIRTTKIATLASQDYTWDVWSLVLWVAIEAAVLIVCACIPTLRPLFRTVMGKGPPSNSQSYGKISGQTDRRRAQDSSTQLNHVHAVRIVGDERASQASSREYDGSGIKATTNITTVDSSWHSEP